jgi:L-asparaginase
MQDPLRKLVILGTGGTIAGRARDPADAVGYRAGEVGVAELLAGVPVPAGCAIEAEQVAQIDSKDMDLALWLRLAQRIAAHLARPEVAGVVVTHGTDTLEETAYFLHRVLAPAKPVVLTAAMRPTTALLADGPQNLLDALVAAATPDARGVVAVVANTVFGAVGLRKWHSYRIDAFTAGDAGPIGRIEEGQLKRYRSWPAGDAVGLAAIERDPAAWPRVEIVVSHAGAGGELIDALVATASPRRVAGIVVAGTGNGTVHHALEAALQRATAAGIAVRRCTRCAAGGVIGGGPAALPSAGDLPPVQARIELMLELMTAG